MDVIDTGNGHVLGYLRHYGRDKILALANFSEQEQCIEANVLRSLTARDSDLGGYGEWRSNHSSGGWPLLTPYRFVWLLDAQQHKHTCSLPVATLSMCA